MPPWSASVPTPAHAHTPAPTPITPARARSPAPARVPAPAPTPSPAPSATLARASSRAPAHTPASSPTPSARAPSPAPARAPAPAPTPTPTPAPSPTPTCTPSPAPAHMPASSPTPMSTRGPSPTPAHAPVSILAHAPARTRPSPSPALTPGYPRADVVEGPVASAHVEHTEATSAAQVSCVTTPVSTPATAQLLVALLGDDLTPPSSPSPAPSAPQKHKGDTQTSAAPPTKRARAVGMLKPRKVLRAPSLLSGGGLLVFALNLPRLLQRSQAVSKANQCFDYCTSSYRIVTDLTVALINV